MRMVVALAIVAGAARAAVAYPHFQVSTGTAQCAQCHLSPAGGGLLTPWGQEEGADTIARGGDGHFLHGAVELPAWLALGGDARLAALANDTGSSEGTELAVFPMQADLAARLMTDQIAFAATIGLRGAVRSGSPDAPPSDPPAGDASGPRASSYIVAREVYAQWHADQQSGPYLRAGRFAAPYGLRLADHTAYVRRYLGYNLLEETLGVSGGHLGERWEIHASVFARDPVQQTTRDRYGAALMAEAQLDEIVLGASARIAVAPDDTRVQAGVHGKLWLEGATLLVQGQLDGVRQSFEAGGARNQLAAYIGPVYIPARGLYTGVAYEAFAEDLAVRSVLRQAVGAWVALFPRAHWEVMLSSRAQRIGPHEHAVVGLLQLHYWL